MLERPNDKIVKSFFFFSMESKAWVWTLDLSRLLVKANLDEPGCQQLGTLTGQWAAGAHLCCRLCAPASPSNASSVIQLAQGKSCLE